MELDTAFGYWLAGYVDGEGCFSFRVYDGKAGVVKSMIVVARADDYPLLEMCQKQTGLGKLHYIKATGTSNPCWRWAVASTSDCLELVDIFEQYSLRSKKRRDFEIWAEAVREHAAWKRPGSGPKNDRARLRELSDELTAVRTYSKQHERTSQ